MSQFWSKLAEIWTRSFLDNFEDNQGGFFEIFSGFMLIFQKKKGNIAIFVLKIEQNSKKLKLSKKPLQNHSKMICFKFQPIWTKIVTLDTMSEI